MFLLTLILILYLFMLFLLQPKPNWKHKRSSWQTLRRCKRIFTHFSESLFAGKINTFFFIAFFFLLLFPARRSSDQKVVNLKVKASQGKKKKKNTIQYSLKCYALLPWRGKHNLAALSIFRTPGCFSYMEGAGHHARPSADGRPPVRCLRCLSKRSESRQPWLQASVTAG